ncbi:MAG TPA: c-type cytochrome [Opitutaceae bacterium]|nr:c-type cytochrome [Opitutaceae bacterium]
MRRVLKTLGYLAAALALLLAVTVAVVYWRSNVQLHRNYTVTVAPVRVPSDPAAIEHGRHIAQTRGCVDCHGADLGGAKVIDDPAMGRAYGPNLTRGRGGRAAELRDEDWVRAIRHGVAKDAHPLYLMPSAEYSHFTDDDLGAVIAYVKSVPPVDRDSVPLSVGPAARALMVAGKLPLAADLINHAGFKPEVVSPGVTVAYGRYLAVGCTGCHGTNFSGGKIDVGPPDWPAAANLTPAGDLARWTEQEFLAALRTARRPDGRELSSVMPRAFGQMTDDELMAIWLFLRTVPPATTGTR